MAMITHRRKKLFAIVALRVENGHIKTTQTDLLTFEVKMGKGADGVDIVKVVPARCK